MLEQSIRSFIRRIYRKTHSKSLRHNEHLWPYVKLSRGDNGSICKIKVFGNDIPIIGIDRALQFIKDDLHIILSGGSVLTIDYSKLPDIQTIGVNGSIALQDKFDIEFNYYCIVDGTFVQSRKDLVKRIISNELILFLTPEVLRYMLEYIHINDIKCSICIIECISAKAFDSIKYGYDLKQLQKYNSDIIVFNPDINPPIGFSFNPHLGWFDAETVAYTALQVAVWGGAKHIYFHGLDIKDASNQPRFYENKNDPRPSTRLEQSFPNFIKPSFTESVKLLAKKNIFVFNLSKISALGPDVIPYLDWNTLEK